jgi:hypothetical protein
MKMHFIQENFKYFNYFYFNILYSTISVTMYIKSIKYILANYSIIIAHILIDKVCREIIYKYITKNLIRKNNKKEVFIS